MRRSNRRHRKGHEKETKIVIVEKERRVVRGKKKENRRIETESELGVMHRSRTGRDITNKRKKKSSNNIKDSTSLASAFDPSLNNIRMIGNPLANRDISILSLQREPFLSGPPPNPPHC